MTATHPSKTAFGDSREACSVSSMDPPRRKSGACGEDIATRPPMTPEQLINGFFSGGRQAEAGQ